MSIYLEKTNQNRGIIRDLTLTVNNNTATLSEPVTIYRGDRGIELHIKIQQFKFRFGKKTVENVVDDTIIGARAIITGPKHKEHNGTQIKRPVDSNNNGKFEESEYKDKTSNPNYNLKDEDGNIIECGTCFEVSAKNIVNNTIIIDIDEQWVDEIHEVGTHTIQIQLYGAEMAGGTYERLTIPPVTFEVAELVCDFEEHFEKISESIDSEESRIYGFEESERKYYPYGFKTGGIIPYDALNAMEDALVYATTELKDGLAQEITDRENAIKDTLTYTDTLVHNVAIDIRKDLKVETDRINTLTEDLNAHKEDAIDKMKALNTTILNKETQLTGMIADLEGDVLNLDYAINTENLDENGKPGLKKRMEVCETNIQTVYSESLRLIAEAENAAIKKSEEYTNSKIDNEIYDRNKAIGDLERKVDDEIDIRTELSTSHALLWTKVEDVEQRTYDNKNTINTLIASDTALNSTVASLSEAHNTINMNIGLNSANIQTNTSNIQTNTANIQVNKDDIDDLKQNVQDVNKDIEELKTRVPDMVYTKDEVYTKEEVDTKLSEVKIDIDADVLEYKRELADPMDLPLDAEVGDSYIIGSSVYVWNGREWDDTDIRGPQGESVELVYSIDEAKDENGNVKSNVLLVEEGSSIKYATTSQLPTKTSQLSNDTNFVSSNSFTKIEIVTAYPEYLEDGVLYILVEPR